jgi:hypothetical protein
MLCIYPVSSDPDSNQVTPTEATYPSSRAENRGPMIRIGSRTWKQCEPQYVSQSPGTDLTLLDHVGKNKRNPPPKLTHPNQIVPGMVDVLQLPIIQCRTL